MILVSFRIGEKKTMASSDNFHISPWKCYEQIDKNLLFTWMFFYDCQQRYFILFGEDNGNVGKFRSAEDQRLHNTKD